MLYELNHFGIVVRDLDASLAFYEGLLGAKTVFRRFVDSSQTHVLYLQLGTSLIELLHPLHPAEDAATGITHIAFMTDDLDGDYTSLIQAGVQGISEPRTAATGVGRLAFLRDPNGVNVELLQRDLVMRGEPVGHPIVAGFDHYALTVTDPDASYGFYSGLLGMRAKDAAAGQASAAAGPDAAVRLTLAGQVLELRPRTAELAYDPTFSHFALRVHGIRPALDLLAGHGVDGDPTDGGAIIRDPDGVAIVLLESGSTKHPCDERKYRGVEET